MTQTKLIDRDGKKYMVGYLTDDAGNINVTGAIDCTDTNKDVVLTEEDKTSIVASIRGD